MTLRLRPEARDDVRIAIAWYDEREPGLGAAFLAEADALFQQITKRARLFPVIHAPFQRALMRRFPYAVYFLAEGDAVVVFAVLHQRQDRAILGERG